MELVIFLLMSSQSRPYRDVGKYLSVYALM